ncbi:hypothetical protein [Cohnella faecalis]|uniref:Uncharacterized protein n=1 Tax=Cohnella faecalis TaxID=2315694 RepID=A0A398CL94_9BACL|nr:hypothetical protein [Cohnella faecalis]RIE00617.1 hypothetical protein D3H35_27545 [Cohnella faecalis]
MGARLLQGNLLRQWFEPTLTPGQVTAASFSPNLSTAYSSAATSCGRATPAPRAEFTGSTTAKPESKSPTEGTGNGDAAGGHNPPTPESPPAASTSPTEGTGFPIASDKR